MVLELRQIFPAAAGGGARYFATSRERAGRERSLSIMCIDDSTIVLEGQAKGELGDARVHWEIRWGGVHRGNDRRDNLRKEHVVKVCTKYKYYKRVAIESA